MSGLTAENKLFRDVFFEPTWAEQREATARRARSDREFNLWDREDWDGSRILQAEARCGTPIAN
jgi:hypothetical protein